MLKGKGSKHFYDTLLNSTYNKLPCYDRWEQLLNVQFTDNDWKIFNIIANKSTQSTDLRWLQYRIIHNILPTRKFLFKIKYIDSPLCSFCGVYPETIDHLFWHCKVINNIWKQLENWILNEQKIPLKFNMQNVVLGIRNKNNNPVNAIILLVKQIIYRHSKRSTIPHIDHIKKDIIRYYDITKCIYYSTCNNDKFHSFWSSLHIIFQKYKEP
jgi:hypothetical protein